MSYSSEIAANDLEIIDPKNIQNEQLDTNIVANDIEIIDSENIQNDKLDEVVGGGCLENPSSSSAPYADNDNVDPHVGMEFDSATDVYNFYNRYAKKVGFGITTVCSRSNNKKELNFKHLACWREGKSRKKDNTMNPRDTGKINCKASIKARLNSKTGKWILDDVIIEHNHQLSISTVAYLRSHRRISTPKKAKISNMHAVNVSTTQTYSAMTRRKGGRRELEFTEKDTYNFTCQEHQSQLKEEDAQLMMIHFTQMQAKNINFFYTLNLNVNGQLRTVFWIHPKSRMACTYFGDVLTFDSTYLTNTYQISFCSFVGVNHHGLPTLLGCALLSDQMTETFTWIFQSWLDANGGQAPNAIITNQDNAIEAAVREVFPNARHRFCLWHILKKIHEKIGHICTAHPKFMVEFDEAIYDTVTTQAFEEKWAQLMDKYEECKVVDWLYDLYKCRDKWVPVYLKDTFFAGMSSSQRSESINHFFDGFVNSKTTLKEFIDKYEDVLENRYEAENEQDNKSLQTNAFLKTSSPFERQAASIYTRCIFKKFQNEILEMAASNAKSIQKVDNCIVYFVKSFERIKINGIEKEIAKNYIVSYDNQLEEVKCQCRLFQFKGYLCRHALLVLHQSEVFRIPDKYFLKRWCKDMKYRFDNFDCDVQFCDKSTRKSRYTLMSHRMMKLAEIGSVSEDAFNLVMTELTPLFKKAVDANCSAHPNSRLLIRDPDNIATKERPREKIIKSEVEKKSKKVVNKTSGDSFAEENGKRLAKRQRTTFNVVEVVQQTSETTQPSSNLILDELDAYMCNQLSQEREKN